MKIFNAVVVNEKPVAYFARLSDARLVKMSIEGAKVEEIVLYEDFLEWDNQKTRKAIQSGLSKLSEEEKQALGLEMSAENWNGGEAGPFPPGTK